MKPLTQSPRDPDFVQNPYPFYYRARATSPLFLWDDYGFPCAASHEVVSTILKDRRFGREQPAEFRKPVPDHLKPFYRIEDNSMLELEPPVHTRLRGLVLRAFTSRRIAALGPEIARLSHDLIDRFEGEVDLITAFAEPLPVIVIARLLGVPEDMAPQLLDWSHAMVAMYQARRDREVEDLAAKASAEFAEFLYGIIADRRKAPRDDLLSHLIAARDNQDRLTEDELIATSVLLLNAGHEATVHTIGNGVKALLENGLSVTPASADPTVEEILRFDPPLHMFTRYALQDVEVFGHRFRRGDSLGLLLGAANRDPAAFSDPHRFDPTRAPGAHVAFGAGIHFCVGAPLARLELKIALPILFERLPGLRLSDAPRYADRYHFHGLEALRVSI